NFVFLLVLGWPDSLDGENRILRSSVSFLANASLLPPKVAVDGVALRQLVIAKALREAHSSAIAEFAQQAEHFPFDVGGPFLRRVTEINFVLDLQAPELRFKYCEFFVSGHSGNLLSAV